MTGPRGGTRVFPGRGLVAFLAASLLALSGASAHFALSSAGADDAASVDDYVKQLEAAYKGTSTLRAQFVQTYDSGGRIRTESGTVYFARSGKMRWEYREPEQKLFLSDGKQLMLYVPSEKQLTRSPVKSSEDARVPFRLLLSHLNLHKVFGRIEYRDQALKAQTGDRVLAGLPKRNQEEDFREVLMEVTPTYDIRRLLIRYPDQSTMEFSFDHIERNVPVSPSMFRFSPPPGTEVIDESE